MSDNLKKIKILCISDHPYAFSGVAIETKNMVEGLLDTGRFQFVCLGGAVKHSDYRPQKFDKYGDDLLIIPVNGYGDPDTWRTLCRQYKPDILWMISDPRLHGPLWLMANELRANVPLVYYHVWDNYPVPYYNKQWYLSNDVICTISKLTDDIVSKVTPEVERHYVPHSVNLDVFKPLPKDLMKSFKEKSLGEKNKDKFVVFWDNRNARRKQSGTLVFWFDKFLDLVGRDKALLLMHTDTKDVHGQDLDHIAEHLSLTNGEVMFSREKLPDEMMNQLYNLADVTVTISDAEGHGRCLEKNTLLQLKNYTTVPIKDVQVGDEILSCDGSYRKVTRKFDPLFKNQYKLKTFKLQDLFLSEDHPISSLTKEEFEEGVIAPSWRPLNKLKVGDYVARNSKFETSGLPLIKEIDIYESLKGKFPTMKCTDTEVYFDMGYSPLKTGLSISDMMNKFGITKHTAEFARRKVLGIEDKKYSGTKNKHIDLIERIKKSELQLNNKIIKCKRKIEIDDDFLLLLGWYMAEGSSPDQVSVEINLHKKELPIANMLGNIISRCFGLESTVSEHPTENKCRIITGSSIFATLMTEISGKYAHFKRLSPEMFEVILDNPSAYVHGLFEGDGCNSVKTRTNSLTTVSRDLAYQTFNILDFHGFTPSIQYYETPEKKGKFHYVVSVHSDSCERFNNDFGFELPFKKKFQKNKKALTLGDYKFHRIYGIEDTEQDVEMYDISVEGTENFIANGILVHNCVMTSLSVGTPVVATKTGGIPDQLTDGTNTFGVLIEPAAVSVIGSQDVPYIHEDRISEKDFLDAMLKMYNMSKEERTALGMLGRKHVEQNFGLQKYVDNWDRILTNVHETRGSWRTRKNYDRIYCSEIK